MPFDYNSFMTGVITGLKLGRVPGERRPPTPVPSGIYILAEDGTPIITEHSNPRVESDATIYRLDEWYAWSGQYVSIKFNPPRTLVGGGYFYWDDGDTIRLVFYSESSIHGSGGGIYTFGAGGESLRVSFSLLGLDEMAGDVHYQALSAAMSSYPPDGMIPFEGTQAEMESWLGTARIEYMITE